MKDLVKALFLACMLASEAQAQVYLPVSVTGFNNDVVADTGTDATLVTTTDLDLSNNILYSQNFGTVNNLPGGMVNTGLVSDGASHSYQLANYIGSNGLYLSANGLAPHSSASGQLLLTTPGVFSKLSVLIFSTEGNSNVELLLQFTDGSTANGGTHTILDWFDGSNAVYSAFGRIDRVTGPPFNVDGIPGINPQFYPLDIMIPCTHQSKTLQRISVNFVSGTTASCRLVVLAVSGISTSPLVVTPAVTNATCGNNNGSIELSVAGGTAPFTYLWNTSPLQTEALLDSLTAGNYTCRVMDANGCASIYRGTVMQSSPLTLQAQADATEVCSGAQVKLNAVATGGNVTSYTWMPGNVNAANITITPGATTTYTVTAQDDAGCSVTASVGITVKPAPTAAFTVQPGTGCIPLTQTIHFTGRAGATATFNWNSFGGAAIQSGSGRGPYTIQFTSPGTHPLRVNVTEAGCIAEARQEVNIYAKLDTPVVTIASVTAGSITFNWLPIPGATTYQVAVNSGSYESIGTATTYTVSNLQPGQTVTIDVNAQGAVPCQLSVAGRAAGNVGAGDIYIPNAFTPNGDGKNEVFRAYGHAITGVHLKVFNQYGELLIESRDLANGWNGMHKDKKQPSGVYTYVIRVQLTDGSSVMRKGFVHLIR